MTPITAKVGISFVHNETHLHHIASFSILAFYKCDHCEKSDHTEKLCQADTRVSPLADSHSHVALQQACSASGAPMCSVVITLLWSCRICLRSHQTGLYDVPTAICSVVQQKVHSLSCNGEECKVVASDVRWFGKPKSISFSCMSLCRTFTNYILLS